MANEGKGWSLLRDFAAQVGGRKLADVVGALQSEEGQKAIGNVVSRAAGVLKDAITEIKDGAEEELLKARLEALQKKKGASGPDAPKL